MVLHSKNKPLPVVATIGQSAFIQSGVAHLAHAVNAGARLILVIIADGGIGDYTRPQLPVLARACGVKMMLEINPCDRERFRTALKQAAEFTTSAKGGIAVIIASRPCVALDDTPRDFLSSPDVGIAPRGCEGCYDGVAVESDVTSIFELAQRVALQNKHKATAE